MFINITCENIDLLDESFIDKNMIKNELISNPFSKIIVYKDEIILGYIYYSDIYERAEINQFEVLLSTRNCGIGSKLLNKMIETIEKNITLEVRSNNYQAIHLYEKYGFRKKAIRKSYYQNIDGILMERIHK